MKITTIFFDLDGTLLPMNQDQFTESYLKLLSQKLAPYGYEPKQLIKSIWTGMKKMIKNDGKESNEKIFWELFCEIYGEKMLEDMPIFEGFYHNEFQKAKTSCGFNPEAAKTVRKLKEDGMRVVLATNPIFPAVATESRIRWTGLEPSEFELYTTYENIGYCKPNPSYYQEILNRLNLKAEECLMVGNDATEDMIAETTGMKVFLLTDCLENKEQKDISHYPQGSFKELWAYIEKLKNGGVI